MQYSQDSLAAAPPTQLILLTSAIIGKRGARCKQHWQTPCKHAVGMQKQPAVHEGRRARPKLKERGQGKRTLHRNRNELACFNHPLTLNPALQGELLNIIKNSRPQWAGIFQPARS